MTVPMPMEKLGQGYGFILYRTHVTGPRESMPIVVEGLHDRAHVFLNGEFRGILYCNDKKSPFRLSIPKEGAELMLLVENMGRVNYGPRMIDRKGVANVRVGRWAMHYHWDALPLPLDNLNNISFGSIKPFEGRPQLLRGSFTVDGTPEDTFVRMDGFKKGVIFVNGKCLSRYWEIGPQMTAYLPAPFLREGENELIVLELDGRTADCALLTDTPDLGKSNPANA
jgi:beta-galactosidase